MSKRQQTLGFKPAPYLEFDGTEPVMAVGNVHEFSAEADADRLNQLLGKAGEKVMEISEKTLEAGKVSAQKAIEGGKQLAEKLQEKKAGNAATSAPSAPQANCLNCGTLAQAKDVYCSGCGNKLAQ